MTFDDLILFVDILECKRKYGKIFYEDEDGVLIESPKSHILYSTTKTTESAKSIVEHLPQHFEILVAHDLYTDYYLQTIKNLKCYHSAYLKKQPLNIILKSCYCMKKLNNSHIQDVIELYKHSMPSLANRNYIEECIRDDMYGVFDETMMCGCIGVHQEESIGILEVRPKYKNKAIAKALLSKMVNVQIEKGRIVYSEIEENNSISLKLQKSVGMDVSDQLTYCYFM